MATGVTTSLTGPNSTGLGSAPWTTFDFSASNYEVDIDQLIALLNPTDTPFQGGMGADGELTLPTGPCFEKDVSWMDETVLTPRTTLAATCVTADTQITVASGDKFRFQPGDLILIDSEYVRVTGYGSGDLLNVTRAVQGSAAQHSNTSQVIGVGSILPEGSDPPNARFNDRNFRSNKTEIFGPYRVEATGSDQAVRKYGVSNEFAKQTANRLKECGVAIEQSIIYGVKFEDTTTANRWRAMGGILSYITTNVDSTTTTSITESAYLAQLQAIYDAGGNADTTVVGSKQKGVMSGFVSAGTLFVQRPDGTRGTSVDTYESDFGTMRIKLHRWFRKSDLLNFSRSQAELDTLRPISFQMLGKTGDSDKGMIVGEKTLRYFRERHSGKFTALT